MRLKMKLLFISMCELSVMSLKNTNIVKFITSCGTHITVREVWENLYKYKLIK